MDLNALAAAVHNSPTAMLLLGFAAAHRRRLFRWGILGVLKVPLLRRVILGHPDEVLADVDDFRAELKEDMEEAAKEDAAAAAASAKAHAAASAPAVDAPAVPPKTNFIKS